MKYQRFLSLVLAVLLILGMTPVRVQAAEQTCGDDAYWRLDDGTLTIRGTGEIYDYYTSSGSTSPWKEMADQITTVVVGDGITKIGMMVFEGLTNLTEVSLPDSLTDIGHFAFQRCKSLESIQLPGALNFIGQHAFAYCTALKAIEIPASVTNVDACAFEGCTALTDVLFRSDPDRHVFIMGNSVFRSCISLEEIRVEEGHLALRSLDGILYFQVPSGELLLNDYPCGRREPQFRIADGTKAVNQLAVSNMMVAPDLYTTWLETVIFPASLDTIGSSAFQCFPNLKRLEFWGSAPEVKQYTFMFCHDEVTVVHPCGDESWAEARNTWSRREVVAPGTIVWEERHDFGSWYTVKAPTPYSDGEKQRDCTVCGHSETGVIPGGPTRGDVDGNSLLDADDAIYLLYHTLFGADLYPVSQDCDYDGNGTVDADDAIYLLFHTLFGSELYPLQP